MSKVNIINPIIDSAWLNFIEHQDKATIFHHPAWLSVLNKQYHFPVFAVCSQDKKGNITAGIPFCEVRTLFGKKKWVSLPFSDYCNPLYSNEDDLKSIIDSIIKEKNRKIIDSIEIRYELPFECGFIFNNKFVLHTLKLSSDVESVFKSFSKKFRQYPRKAEREGLYLENFNSTKNMKIFYDLHSKTRKKLGVPIQPKNFFQLLRENMIYEFFRKELLAFYRDTPISASVVLKYKKHAMIKYSTSDPLYLHLRPHYFIFWESIKWAALNGCDEIDFGKTEVNNLGLRIFKNGWGAEEKELKYSYYPEVPESSLSEKVQNKFLRPLIQNSPSFVCRMIGELFYKYSG